MLDLGIDRWWDVFQRFQRSVHDAVHPARFRTGSMAAEEFIVVVEHPEIVGLDGSPDRPGAVRDYW